MPIVFNGHNKTFFGRNKMNDEYVDYLEFLDIIEEYLESEPVEEEEWTCC